MGVFGKMLDMVERHRQARAEREALRLLIARKDRRLLRDAGLMLFDEGEPRCAALPQTKERRWMAPLTRLPASSNKKPLKEEKRLGFFPSPRLREEGDRRAG